MNYASENQIFKKLRYSFELVKFSHTIFALPFALAAFLIASRGAFTWKTLCWVLLCVLSARTAAMAFNRLVDARIDAKNPRTQDRHVPAGLLSKRFVLLLILISSAAFLYSSYQINFLTFILAPLCLSLLFFYSFTKRFTHFTQIFLGLALGMAPVGAAIAATGVWSWNPLILGLAVLFWVAGFDLLYALQDLEFDRRHGIYSLSAYLGISRSFRVSSGLHLLFFLCLAWYGYQEGMGIFYWLGVLVTGVLLYWQHTILNEDLEKIQASFFTANGALSLFFLGFVIADLIFIRSK